MKVYFIDDEPEKIQEIWEKVVVSEAFKLVRLKKFISIVDLGKDLQEENPDIIFVDHDLSHTVNGVDIARYLYKIDCRAMIFGNSAGGLEPFHKEGVVLRRGINKSAENLKNLLDDIGKKEIIKANIQIFENYSFVEWLKKSTEEAEKKLKEGSDVDIKDLFEFALDQASSRYEVEGVMKKILQFKDLINYYQYELAKPSREGWEAEFFEENKQYYKNFLSSSVKDVDFIHLSEEALKKFLKMYDSEEHMNFVHSLSHLTEKEGFWDISKEIIKRIFKVAMSSKIKSAHGCTGRILDDFIKFSKKEEKPEEYSIVEEALSVFWDYEIFLTKWNKKVS